MVFKLVCAAAKTWRRLKGVLRGNQDARGASIWMRKCRRMRDGRRA
jgi:hypothetical protein